MKLINALKLYWKKDMIIIFFLSISSGFPLALCLGTLTIWLTEVGIKKETIGLFGAITFPYALKILWAPIFDICKIPILSRLLGKRRAWLLVTQICLMFAVIALGLSSPEKDASITAFLTLLVSFFSASQDINFDAYRVEALPSEQYGQASAVSVFGYTLSYTMVSGAGALYLSYIGLNWHIVYIIMSLVTLIGMIAVIFARKSLVEDKKLSGNHLHNSVIIPFSDFAKRNGWILFLLIILLYKIPDAALGALANNFYLETGFDKLQILSVSKIYGLAASLIGTFLGGLLVSKYSLYRAIMIGLFLQTISVLYFSYQAVAGKNIYILITTIGFENLGGGISAICLVVLISNLCNRQFAATQFALFSSISSLGRTFLRAPSGYIAAATGWFWFFVICAATAIPCFLIIFLAKKHIKNLETKVDMAAASA